MLDSKKYKIVLYGFGTVGKGWLEMLQTYKLSSAELIGIVVKHKEKHLYKNFPYTIEVYESEQEKTWFQQADILIECTNDYHEGLKIIQEALQKGKIVFSASKKILAEHLEQLLQLSEKYKSQLFYEPAAVASVPIFKILKHHFLSERLLRIKGILNGTSNYILTQMEQNEMEFIDALQQAQRLGYAERDPFSDISGQDTAYKLVLLTHAATQQLIKIDQFFIEGIQNLTVQSIQFAKRHKLTIKLIAHADFKHSCFWVCPTFVPLEDTFASLRDAFNAVLFHYAQAGEQIYIGKGAGKEATGSALWADLQNFLTHQPKYNSQYHLLSPQDNIQPLFWMLSFENPASINKIQNTLKISVITSQKQYMIVKANLEQLNVIKHHFPKSAIIQIPNEAVLQQITHSELEKVI